MAQVKGGAFVPTDEKTCYVDGPLAGIKVKKGVWINKPVSTFDKSGKRTTKWVKDYLVLHDLDARTPSFTHYKITGRKNYVATKTRGHYELVDGKYLWVQDEIIDVVKCRKLDDDTYERIE